MRQSVPGRSAAPRRTRLRTVRASTVAASEPATTLPAFSAHALDTAAAASVFACEGWVLVRGVLSADELAELHAGIDVLERAAAQLTTSQRLNGVFCEVQSASGRKGEPAVVPGALRKLTGPSRRSAAWARLRAHPLLERLVAGVCGVHAPMCVVDQANTKLPLVGSGFPWHQDASFLFGHAAAALRSRGGANAVVALDRSDAGCGGFEVLGRTHAQATLVDLRGVYDTGVGAGAAARWDESRRACPTLEPGDALLFHPLLAHGSAPNASPRRRRLATLWFVGGEPG